MLQRIDGRAPRDGSIDEERWPLRCLVESDAGGDRRGDNERAHDNPGKSPTIRGFTLSAEQRDDLIAFLRSLTDEPLLHDRRFSNPWTTGSSVH